MCVPFTCVRARGLTLTPAIGPEMGKTRPWLVTISVSLATVAGSLFVGMTYLSSIYPVLATFLSYLVLDI